MRLERIPGRDHSFRPLSSQRSVTTVLDRVIAAAGRLPPEDPATCSESAPEAALIRVPLDDPGKVREAGCLERTDDSSIRYREPPADAPDLTGLITACAHLPSFEATVMRLGGFGASTV